MAPLSDAPSGKGGPDAPDPATGAAGDPMALRREVLLAGIQDMQGTIQANDAKCSAALITHGLLFAGLLAVSTGAAELYPEADDTLRVVVAVMALLALLAFATSIIFLLIAVKPLRPKGPQQVNGADVPRVFYPEPDRTATKDARMQMNRVEALTPASTELELVCESLKLAEIRDHEATFAGVGYAALIVEVGVAAVYLILVAAMALGSLS